VPWSVGRRAFASAADVEVGRGSHSAAISPALFAGAAVASIGGPLALVALYVPGALGDAVRSSGLTVVLAVAVFLAPLAAWLRYSRRIVSAGGIVAFVEAAAGRRVAQLHAVIWSISYFLYLPYTVTYVVYDVLAVVFPGIDPYRASLELLLPVAIVLLVLAPVFVALALLSLAAVIQIVLVVVLGAITYSNVPAHTSSFARHVGASATLAGLSAVALLFVCASLPLFFGAEVVGGRRTVRRGLTVAYLLVALPLIFAVVPLASVPQRLREASLPGVAIAQAYSGRPLAVVIGLGSAVSVVGLIILEFLALARLAHWSLRLPVRPMLAAIGVAFVLADALSLINPNRFYDDLLRPSLIALFTAQLVVFLVFPLFELRGRGSPRAVAAAIAVGSVAAALMGYGLYTAVSNAGGT
jgi:amino acid transporter